MSSEWLFNASGERTSNGAAPVTTKPSFQFKVHIFTAYRLCSRISTVRRSNLEPWMQAFGDLITLDSTHSDSQVPESMNGVILFAFCFIYIDRTRR